MPNTILSVILKTTLKRIDGSLFANGTRFKGTISELPEEIRRAVIAKKDYLEITELPAIENLPEIKQEDVEGVGSAETGTELNPDTVTVETEDTKPVVVKKKSLKTKKEQIMAKKGSGKGSKGGKGGGKGC